MLLGIGVEIIDADSFQFGDPARRENGFDGSFSQFVISHGCASYARLLRSVSCCFPIARCTLDFRRASVCEGYWVVMDELIRCSRFDHLFMLLGIVLRRK